MIYKTYLKTEHSDENIEFWLACEAYKKITSQRKRISVARKLFTHYIQPQAPNEVTHNNMSSLFPLIAIPMCNVADKSNNKWLASHLKGSENFAIHPPQTLLHPECQYLP